MSRIFVVGTMQVRPGDVDRLKTPVARQIAAVRAMDGCELYSLGSDISDPTLIQVAERWRDQPSMGAHLVADHMVQFNIDLRAARLVSARVDSFHPDGEARKMIDHNAPSARFVKHNPALVIVMGTARLAAGEIERLAPALAHYAETVRGDDGCEHYSFARDALEPNLLHIAERWRDGDALAAHLASAHVAAFNELIAGAQIVRAEVQAFGPEGERTMMTR